MPVYRLPKENIFPMPELAQKNGLLAIGGDLSIERLLLAYQHGIFPWYNPGEVIQWWCTKPRFVLFPNEIKISKSMKKLLKKLEEQKWEIEFNKDFQKVIRQCKKIREKEGTWITNEMEEAYIKLFQNGFALSVATYQNKKLVGGLYGVNIGKCFFGESMFSKVSNASKLALIMLAKRLEKEDYLFIDCQVHTNHLENMGARFIQWNEFKQLLEKGTKVD